MQQTPMQQRPEANAADANDHQVIRGSVGRALCSPSSITEEADLLAIAFHQYAFASLLTFPSHLL